MRGARENRVRSIKFKTHIRKGEGSEREKIGVRRKISKSKRMREKPHEIERERNDLKNLTQRNGRARS